MSHGLAAAQVPRLRRLAYRYLRETAPAVWVQAMQTGIRFHVPADLAGMGAAKQARRLASAEARRLRRARLFHMDSAATWVVERMGTTPATEYVLARERVPAEYGLLVWEQPIITTSQGQPVTACHWQARNEDVWVAWWTDATVADAGAQDPLVEALAQYQLGPLGYEQEMVLPYGVVGADLRGDQDDARRRWDLIRCTLRSWSLFLITAEGVEVSRLPEADQSREPDADAMRDGYGDAPAVPGVEDSVTTMTIRLHQPPGPLSRLRRFLRRGGGADVAARP